MKTLWHFIIGFVVGGATSLLGSMVLWIYAEKIKPGVSRNVGDIFSNAAEAIGQATRVV